MTFGHEIETHALRDRYGPRGSRDREVMVLVALGLLNKQIWSKFAISDKTVKAQRGGVMGYMKIRWRADLVKTGASLCLVSHGSGGA